MRTFLISYDLTNPAHNRHALTTAIMSLGQSWARPLEHTWYVRTGVRKAEVESALSPLLDADDGLIVQAVDEDAALTNTSLRWFRQRSGIDVSAAGNVVAFPVVSPPPTLEPELPLAQAS